MTNLIKTNQTETISSLQISKDINKRHSDVLRDVRNLSESLLNADMRSLWFTDSYKDKSGKTNPMFQLTKKGSLLLASGYDANLRLAIINRWEELEKDKLPQSFSQALMLAAKQQELIEKQDKIIEIQKEQKFVDQKLIDVLYDKEDRNDLIPKWRNY